MDNNNIISNLKNLIKPFELIINNEPFLLDYNLRLLHSYNTYTGKVLKVSLYNTYLRKIEHIELKINGFSFFSAANNDGDFLKEISDLELEVKDTHRELNFTASKLLKPIPYGKNEIPATNLEYTQTEQNQYVPDFTQTLQQQLDAQYTKLKVPYYIDDLGKATFLNQIDSTIASAEKTTDIEVNINNLLVYDIATNLNEKTLTILGIPLNVINCGEVIKYNKQTYRINELDIAVSTATGVQAKYSCMEENLMRLISVQTEKSKSRK